AATLDAARALIAEADAARRAPAPAQAEGIVRDWWVRRRERAARRPISKVEAARTGVGGEKRRARTVAGARGAGVAAPLPFAVRPGPEMDSPVARSAAAGGHRRR